jgi:hypothetical protein
MKRIRNRYYCTKCGKKHNAKSKVYKEHREFLLTPEKKLEIEKNK